VIIALANMTYDKKLGEKNGGLGHWPEEKKPECRNVHKYTNTYKAAVFHGCRARTKSNRTKMHFQSKGLCSYLNMMPLCDVRAHITPVGVNGEEKGFLVCH